MATARTTRAPRTTATTAARSPARETARKAARKPAPAALALQRPEVLLGCFHKWSAAAFTDRPEQIVAAVRAVLPSGKRRAAAKRSFVANVGVVRWSATHDCLWITQPINPGGVYCVDPARIGSELRARVATEEPPRAPSGGHIFSAPPPSSPRVGAKKATPADTALAKRRTTARR